MNARATIQNCHVDGTVSINGLSSTTVSAHGQSVNPYCGGIAGYLQLGTVEGCTSAAVVTGGSDITTYSGGIVGQIGAITSRLINCFSIGFRQYSGTDAIPAGKAYYVVMQ